MRAVQLSAECFLVIIVNDSFHEDERPIFSVNVQPCLVQLQKRELFLGTIVALRVRVLESTSLTSTGRIIETIGNSTSDWEGFRRGVINDTALVSLLFVKEATEKGGLSRDP
jgi:hypothetical protein